jgi:hypothetical protein
MLGNGKLRHPFLKRGRAGGRSLTVCSISFANNSAAIKDSERC